MHQGLAAAAHNSSRKQGRESDDLLGWHNRSLRSSATRRKGPTILHKLRTLCGSLKELARSNASSEPSLLAAEWPKPEDIVLDAVYKKLCSGNVWTARRILVTRASTLVRATLHIVRVEDSEILESIPVSSVIRLSCSEFDLVRDLSTEHGPLKTYLHNSEQTAADTVPVPLTFSFIAISPWLETQKQIHFKSCDPHAPALDMALWVKELAEIMKRDLALTNRMQILEGIKRVSKQIFDLPITRWVFATLIFLSFVSDVAQAQILPDEGSHLETVFSVLETVFTLIFLFELVWNFVSNFLQPFLNDGWSVFDTLVVAVSLVSSFGSSDSDGIKSIRLVRVARAVRLVGRFRSLRAILDALTQSIFPVLSASIVCVMTMSIFAILGVEFFKDSSPTYFGDFGLAMFTLFATVTMENWVAVAVDMMGGDPTKLDSGVMFFFVSYIVLVGYVFTSVVVAVLLDKFSAAQAREQDSAAITDTAATGGGVLALKVSSNPLDPLLQQLSTFENSQDLTNRIGMLFEALDVDESGTVSGEEMVIGLAKLRLTPGSDVQQIRCTLSDYNDFTRDRTLCLPDGSLDRRCFESILRRQLRDYISRSIASTGIMKQACSSPGVPCVLAVLLAGMNQILVDVNTKSEYSFAGSPSWQRFAPADGGCPFVPVRSDSCRAEENAHKATKIEAASGNVTSEVQPNQSSKFENANGRENQKYEIVAGHVHPRATRGTGSGCDDEAGVLGVTGLCIVPPPPLHVLEAMEDKAGNIIVSVLKLQVLLKGLQEAGGQAGGGEDTIGVAIIADSALAQIQDVIAQSQQLLCHAVIARQDVKREELSRRGRITEMKSPNCKTSNINSIDSTNTKDELQTDVSAGFASTLLTVMQKQKQAMQLSPRVRERDTSFNHIARHMAEETEETGNGGGRPRTPARTVVDDDVILLSSKSPATETPSPLLVSQATPHTDVFVTMDLDVRKEVFPDFLERLQDDLYLATGHKAGNFCIKAVLPDDVHSVIELRIWPCAEENSHDHNFFASLGHMRENSVGRSPSQIADDLKQQLTDPLSKLCNGKLTCHISSVLIRNVYELPLQRPTSPRASLDVINSNGPGAVDDIVSLCNRHGLQITHSAEKGASASLGDKSRLLAPSMHFSTRSSAADISEGGGFVL